MSIRPARHWDQIFDNIRVVILRQVWRRASCWKMNFMNVHELRKLQSSCPKLMNPHWKWTSWTSFHENFCCRARELPNATASPGTALPRGWNQTERFSPRLCASVVRFRFWLATAFPRLISGNLRNPLRSALRSLRLISEQSWDFSEISSR